jgi:dUTP pyrophosphatase
MQPKASITRLSKDVLLPRYHTAKAVGLDLSARSSISIPARTIAKVPLGVVVSPPDGYWTMLVPRSSLHKKGLLPANGVGIIDPDFSGPGDEYQALLYNSTDYLVTIEAGERIMQAVFLPFLQPTIEEVSLTSNNHPTRGGFGSTGNHA